MLHRLRLYLEVVKFSHTVFALPFALMGAFLAAGGLPPRRAGAWMIVAVVGARTCAMAFNRLADRRLDALNPRTADRALATGLVSVWEGVLLMVAGGVVFVTACGELNGLALALAPIVLALTLGYSLTKRVTAGSHLVLGAALGFAPFGGWVAVRGDAGGYPVALSIAVLFWVAGFDTVYACLDEAFDRRTGLHSLPAHVGCRAAMWLARAFHGAAFAGFVVVGVQCGLGLPYAIGLVAVAAALLAQHLAVSPDDVGRIDVTFFAMNGVVSVALFVSTWLGLVGA